MSAMQTAQERTAPLGDLVAAVYDEAARYSADPQEVARLVSLALRHLLLTRAGASTEQTRWVA